MDDLVNPYHAAQLVHELEQKILSAGEMSSGSRGASASVADAPDGVSSVPGVPEPPD